MLMLINDLDAGDACSVYVSYKQTGQIFCYIRIVKSMRSISPFISALLIVLVLSGSTGFTLIKHTCYHCGNQNLVTSLTSAGTEDKCCCVHDDDIARPPRNVGEYVL